MPQIKKFLDATGVSYLWDSIVSKLNTKADKSDTTLDTTLSRGRKDNTSVGSASLAFGVNTEASGYYSVALGLNTTAERQGAYAEGKGTVAHYIAHAEGENSQALNSWSHAQNLETQAKGAASSANGRHTIATGADSFVFGKYNAEDSYDNWPTWVAGTSYAIGDRVKRNLNVQNTPTDVGYHCKIANSDEIFTSSHWELDGYHMNFVEIVGNGKEDEDPNTHEYIRNGSNARALDWNGNEFLQGDVYIGCNADSTGGTKVATVNDILNKLITNPQDGQVLVYNGTAGKWVNGAGGGGAEMVIPSFTATMSPQSITCDKTYAEIYTAASQGLVPYALLTVTGMGSMTLQFDGFSDTQYLVFKYSTFGTITGVIDTRQYFEILLVMGEHSRNINISTVESQSPLIIDNDPEPDPEPNPYAPI